MTMPEGSGSAADPAHPEVASLPRDRPTEWIRLLVAVLIALAGILLSVLAWNALRSTDQVQVQARLETTAAEFAFAFESGLAQQQKHLRDLGLTWSRSVPEDANRWQA